MPRIGLEQIKTAIRQFLGGRRKPMIALPKIGRGEMLHNSSQLMIPR
jgi:hypothetical protein